jgi:hypothetical protein
MTWSELPAGARLFRLAHVVWGVFGMASLAVVWSSALRRRRGPLLATSMAFLSLEGVALVIGRGNCPFGPLQSRLGDPVPMFELLLPPRAAKAAIPALVVVTLVGFAAVAVRGPRPSSGQPVSPADGRLGLLGSRLAVLGRERGRIHLGG